MLLNNIVISYYNTKKAYKHVIYCDCRLQKFSTKILLVPEYVSGSKSASIVKLFKIPSIIITGLVIVVVSNTWAFLDPTLEPHLRQFNLSTQQIGLIFLLFSSLYGIFSPIWGWVADR